MILSIETATELCGVALVDKQRCIAERIVIEKNIHSERLMVLVDEVLREAGIEVGSLDGIAVSIGPGSFTGLRIGLSAAKGLAYARSLPLLAVPTLDAIAFEAVRIAGRDPSRPVLPEIICAAVDAKKDEAYYAFYESVPASAENGGRAGDIRCITPHAIAAVSEIAAQFPAGKAVCVAGDASKKIAAALDALQGRGADFPRSGGGPVRAPLGPVQCSPAAVGLLAERRFPLLTVGDYSELEPVYIRDFVTTMPRIANHTAIP